MSNPQDEAEKSIQNRRKNPKSNRQLNDSTAIDAAHQITDELTRLRFEVASIRVALEKLASK